MKRLEVVCPVLLALLSFAMFTFPFTTNNALSGGLQRPLSLKSVLHPVVRLAQGRGEVIAAPRPPCLTTISGTAILVHTRVTKTPLGRPKQGQSGNDLSCWLMLTI